MQDTGNWELSITKAIQRVKGHIGRSKTPLSKPDPKRISSELKHKDLKACLSPEGLASMIDHTLLKPDAAEADLERICAEAVENNFRTVCVNSASLPFIVEKLKGSEVLPIAVVGFPLGATLTRAKVFETEEAIRAGAEEIDMVTNIGALKSQDFLLVYEDVKAVACASGKISLKVIIETSLLTDEEKAVASFLAMEAGAVFVKTSTGFSSGGATERDIRLIREVVGDAAAIKASGGIKTYDDATRMIKAGADRIGSSSGVSIIREARKRKGI